MGSLREAESWWLCGAAVMALHRTVVVFGWFNFVSIRVFRIDKTGNLRMIQLLCSDPSNAVLQVHASNIVNSGAVRGSNLLNTSNMQLCIREHPIVH